MNVYNEAHNLAAAIKGSEEFKQYHSLREKIDKSPELSAIVNDFQAKQLDFQMKQMMGGPDAAGAMQQLQELYAVMTKDPVTAEYMQAEIRFTMMMNDVYKILGDAMGLNFDKLTQE